MSSIGAPSLAELVRPPELQLALSDLFPSSGSIEWEIRQHRREYIAGGALFEIAGRLLAHPARFREVAMHIGLRKLATRHGVEPPPPST